MSDDGPVARIRGERSDADLLDAHVAGDPDAFGVLFSRHRDRLWAVALRTTANREDAADALQDAMVAAFRRAGTFRGESAVTTWLHRVVVNACLDRARAAKVRAAQPLPDDLEEHARHGAVVSATDDAEVDPATRVEDDERRRAVLAALADLPPETRAALVLVDMEGYPVAEVARMLGCPVGTVKSRCARGRARLAVTLAGLRTVRNPGGGAAVPPVGPTPGTGAPADDGRPVEEV